MSSASNYTGNVSGAADAADCGTFDDDYRRTLSLVQYWCEGVLFAGFGAVGVAANLLSAAVIASKRSLRQHFFNKLLVALAALHCAFIVVSVPVYSFTAFGILQRSEIYSYLYVYFFYPMSPVTLCASTYMTVAIALERYFVVTRPQQDHATAPEGRRFAAYVLPVVLLSVLLNVPKWLETEVAPVIGANGTDDVYIEMNDFRLQPTFIHYYALSQMVHPTITTGIAPMAALIFLNARVFSGVRRSQRFALTATAPPSGGEITAEADERAKRSKAIERNLTFVMVFIVAGHFLCHSLRVVMATVAVGLIGDTVRCVRAGAGFFPPLWTMVAESVAILLVMLNFCGNILIYMAVLKSFKATAFKLVRKLTKMRRRRRSNQPTTADSSVVDGPNGRRPVNNIYKRRMTRRKREAAMYDARSSGVHVYC